MPRRLLILTLFLLLPMGLLYTLWSDPTSAGEDDVVFFYPMRVMVARQLAAGHLPLWNEFSATGAPLMGDPQTGTFFPPNWLFLAAPAKLAYSLCLFAAFATAGGGAYLYLRQIGLNRTGAIFGGVAFMFCGFMLGHRVHLGVIQTAGMLPWGLLGIEKLRRRPLSGLLILAPVFALALAAGHWPTVIHMGVAWAAYLFLRGPGEQTWPKALLGLAGAGVLAGALMACQLAVTLSVIRSSFRAGLSYSTVTENSFFPLAGVLAFFPFFFGNRTPNFFAQEWWGPWHLCEMLGYVGLVSLVLAAAGVTGFVRRPKPQPAAAQDDALRPVGRVWLILAIGAGVWMLGGYLPTYRLIYWLPVLGSVRCPGRMVLVLDLALAVLAAVAIHQWTSHPDDERLKKALRKMAMALPLVMLVVLAALVGLAYSGYAEVLGPMLSSAGSVREKICAAASLACPATYIPLALAALTLAAIWHVTARPRRAWLLVVLLAADLAVPARFVDVPPADRPAPNPALSPAADWLAKNAPAGEPWRVLGLSSRYHDRPAELLLPDTSGVFRVPSLSYYGPLQPLEHAQLFGFRPWGENYFWPWLVRTNHLLSLFNVRYIVAAEPAMRDVVESVRATDRPEQPGTNLLSDAWAGWGFTRQGDTITLTARHSWESAEAAQPCRLDEGQVYRIAMDVRAPQGQDNLLAAVWLGDSGQTWWNETPSKLRLDSEQLTKSWRHFEWTFTAPAAGADPLFKLVTTSQKPIEVRNARLSLSRWEQPMVSPADPVKPGQAVYLDRTSAGLPALRQGDEPVHIYENLLASSQPANLATLDLPEPRMEALRWEASEPSWAYPEFATKLPYLPLLAVQVAGALLYLGIAVWGSRGSNRSQVPLP